MIAFTVIIPNLNTPTIGEAIQAVELQDFNRSQFEVIVVGMDQFGVIQESDLTRFDRSEGPLSPARARNRGAKQARGEILAFIDADCLPHSDWLSVLAGRFETADVGVVGGGVEFDRSAYWTLADNLSMFHEYMSLHPAGERRQLPSLNLAIRRNLFETLGGFDERYPRPAGEDADLTIRLRKSGQRLHFEPRAVVMHRPPRDRWIDLLRHGYYQGKYSTKVDSRYAAEDGLPGLLRSRPGLILASPFLAAVATLRPFAAYPALRAYWRTVPAIFTAKLAWCLGAARHPW